MTSGLVSAWSEALEIAGSDLRRFETDADRALSAFGDELRRIVHDVEAELRRRSTARVDAERELAAADDDEVLAARRWLEKCQRREDDAQVCLRTVVDCADAFRGISSRFKDASHEHVRRGAIELRDLVRHLETYGDLAGGTFSMAGLGGAFVTGGGSSDSSAVVEGGDTGALGAALAAEGLTLISVSAADFSDNPILSWSKATRSDYAWAVERWESTLAPALAAGKGRDFLAAADERRGASPMRTLAGVYDLMVRSEAIVVEADGDGGWAVTNGRHRIEAARAAGIDHLPARIMGELP